MMKVDCMLKNGSVLYQTSRIFFSKVPDMHKDYAQACPSKKIRAYHNYLERNTSSGNTVIMRLE